MFQSNPVIENQEIVRRYRQLLKAWNARKTEQDKEKVRQAYNLAVEAHKGMRRRSGEPYVYHPPRCGQDCGRRHWAGHHFDCLCIVVTM